MNSIQKYNDCNIQDFLQLSEIKKQIKIALGNKNVDRYIRGVLTTIVTSNNNLMKCSNLSIFRAILTAAQLELDVDAKQHAYLVPFFSKKNNCYETVLIPGYRGYVFKIRNSTLINSINVDIVYKGDKFNVIKGSDPRLEHLPDINSETYSNPDAITHFYVNLKMKTGENEFEIITRKEAEKIRNFVEEKNKRKSIFWRNYFGEMGKKTVIRRLQKMLQLDDITLTNMTVIDNALDDGKKAYIENGNVIIDEIIEEDDNIDTEITEEKKMLIEKVGQQFAQLNLSNADKINYCAKFLHTAVPAHSKIENLKSLSNKLSGLINE